MSPELSAKIQSEGANACASGIRQLNNPFYTPGEMPSATGESLDIWQWKVEQWISGWQAEDASQRKRRRRKKWGVSVIIQGELRNNPLA